MTETGNSQLNDLCIVRLVEQKSCLPLEPNSYEKKAGIRVDGYQLGQDFVQLRKILQESKLYNNTGLYGPDISQPRDHRKDLLEGWEFVPLCSLYIK